ncbi:MAG: endonuclease dU [Candidatus Hodarchaeales archaeon]|jgi:endonuclease V-like protein UPF0215 family
MKSFDRILSIASGKVFLTNNKPVPIVGVLFQKLSIEHLFIKYIEVDPIDLTNYIIELVPVKFLTNQIKLVFLSNTIMAGLGVVDLNKLHSYLQIPIIVLVDKKPCLKTLEEPLRNLNDGIIRKKILQANPTDWVRVPASEKLRLMSIGIDLKKALQLIKEFQKFGNVPEPLRIAILVARSLPNQI